MASARSVSSIRPIFSDVPLNLPVIEFNGAMISNIETGRHLVINNIDSGIVRGLCSVIDAHGFAPFVSTYNAARHEDCLYFSSITGNGMKWFVDDRTSKNDKRLRFIPEIENSFEDEIICVNVIGSLNELAPLQHAMREQFRDSLEIHCMLDTYSPGWYWLTAHSLKATKNRAIRMLQKKMSLLHCRLVVFGDNTNDRGMFSIADHSIAVANATEQMKECASEVIGNNNSNSVVKYMKNYLKKG